MINRLKICVKDYRQLSEKLFTEAAKFLGTTPLRTRIEVILALEQFMREEPSLDGKAAFLTAISTEIAKLEKMEPADEQEKIIKDDMIQMYSETGGIQYKKGKR